MSFKAIQVTKTGDAQTSAVVDLSESDLMAGEVTVQVEFSTVNYKDALAISGAIPFIQKFPLVPGIDFAGTVLSSSSGDFKEGDKVLLNGYGLGESHHGGFAQLARVPSKWLVKVPEPLTTRQAMAIGTAGYTAMLSVMALEQAGVRTDGGDILVTGAAGGVGSVAIALLSKLGYRVVASTGRPDEAPYLRTLGAADVIDRNTLSSPGQPVGAERWAGAIDSVGSHTLANVLAGTKYGGAVTACGLAQGLDIPATLLPFITRAISLIGIDSVNASMAKRTHAWSRLASDLDLGKLESMIQTIALEDVLPVLPQILAGKIRGRTVVDLQR
nr:MDR family oxidoreductase [uncultured Roseateles sp.]